MSGETWQSEGVDLDYLDYALRTKNRPVGVDFFFQPVPVGEIYLDYGFDDLDYGFGIWITVFPIHRLI